jgi:hypothetical protein
MPVSGISEFVPQPQSMYEYIGPALKSVLYDNFLPAREIED